MELFQLREGPWEKIFEGRFWEHETALYRNAANVLLSVAADEKAGMREGALLQAYRVFACRGEAGALARGLGKDYLLFSRRTDNGLRDYLLLASKPKYIPWKEEAAVEEADALLAGLAKRAHDALKVAAAYDVELTALGEADAADQQLFFSEPLTVGLLRPVVADAVNVSRETRVAADVLLGRTAAGQMVSEPLSLLRQTAVIGGRLEERERVLHVLIEGALQASVPVIVLDKRSVFSGLTRPAQNRQRLRDAGVEAEPMGFPVKILRPGENLALDLNDVDAKALLEAFGVQDKEVKEVVELVLANSKVRDLHDLALQLRNFFPTERLGAYKVNKAVRVLTMVDAQYPGFFRGEPLFAAGLGGDSVNRAHIVQLEEADDRASLLVAVGVARGLARLLREGNRTHKPGLLLAVNEVPTLSGDGEAAARHDALGAALQELVAAGGAFAVSGEREIDLPSLPKEKATRLEIVSGNDVGVQLPGRKRYRLRLRPPLSRLGALEN